MIRILIKYKYFSTGESKMGNRHYKANNNNQEISFGGDIQS